MTVVFRSENEPAASRFERMHQVFDDSLVPVEIRPDTAPEDRRETVVAGDIGPVRVTEATTSSPVECFRTPRLIRRSDANLYQVIVQSQGTMEVDTDGRHAVLGPGDLTIVDTSHPGRGAHSAGRVVTILFPPALLSLRRADVARLTATRISGTCGTGALVSGFARQLPRHLHDYDAGEGVRLGTAVLDLLAVALAARLHRAEVRPDTRQRAMLLRIRTFIEERLADPSLSPGTIAAAHHISLRHLHKLFESQEMTVADSIRHRRLERCRRDLLDPALGDRPVSAIGLRWGFTDAAHFSRAFKAAYGVPPGQYRLALLNGSRDT